MIISKKHQQKHHSSLLNILNSGPSFCGLICWSLRTKLRMWRVKAFKILKFLSAPNLDLYIWGPGPSSARIRCWKGEWRHQAAPARSRGGRSGSLSCNYNSAPGPAACMLPLPRTHILAPRTIRSIRRFVITEKDPTRAFPWLKAPTSDFTFKTRAAHRFENCSSQITLQITF